MDNGTPDAEIPRPAGEDAGLRDDAVGRVPESGRAYGCVIFSGFTSWSNSSPVRYPSFSAASRRLECST